MKDLTKYQKGKLKRAKANLEAKAIRYRKNNARVLENAHKLPDHPYYKYWNQEYIDSLTQENF